MRVFRDGARTGSAGDEIQEKESAMFDHIQLKVRDLESSKRFYTAALAPLGFGVEYEADGLVGFGPKGAPALWLSKGNPNGPVHVAFAAKNRAAVRAFYAAGLPAGGTDNGEPGL